MWAKYKLNELQAENDLLLEDQSIVIEPCLTWFTYQSVA